MNSIGRDGNCTCDKNRTHGMDCPIIREFRMPAEQRQEEYRKLLRAKQAEFEGGAVADIPYRLQQLGVPHDALRALRNSLDTVALKWAHEFCGAPGAVTRTLVLGGPRGIGKTVGAAAVLFAWAKTHDWNSGVSGGKQHAPAVWMNAQEITQATEYGQVDQQWLEGCRMCRVLVVDDLGKDSTAPGLAALSSLLTERHDKLRKTIITSNMLPGELAKRYGDSWFERLKTAAIVPNLANEKSLRKTWKPTLVPLEKRT